MVKPKFTISKQVVKTILAIIAVLLISGFGYMVVTNINSLKLQIKEGKVKLDEKDKETKKLKSSRDKINEELEKLKSDHNSSQEKIKELEQQKQDLESQLQAKLEQKARLAQAAKTQQAQAAQQAVAQKAAQPVAQTATRTFEDVPNYETCKSWMIEAGITDFKNAFFIFFHESNCRPRAVNAQSGAYGVCQALPANKLATAGTDWETNPITQMKWCNSYALSRYGSWESAVRFWEKHRWW